MSHAIRRAARDGRGEQSEFSTAGSPEEELAPASAFLPQEPHEGHVQKDIIKDEPPGREGVQYDTGEERDSR